MKFGKSYWQSFDRGIEREWLLTNGIGGFASSTICGANARRYHGLLVAALNPPVERHLVLSKLDESVSFSDKSYNIYSFKTGDGYIMEGFYFLESFEAMPLPTYSYRIDEVFIDKTISMVYGENTTVVVYNISTGSKEISMKITPLANFRNYHFCSKKEHMSFTHEAGKNSVLIKPYNLPLNISIECDKGIFSDKGKSWFYNMNYPIEKRRGLDYLEDHYIPGFFSVDIPANTFKTICIKISTEKEPSQLTGEEVIKAGQKRLKAIYDKCPYDDTFAKRLFMAGDAFIVKRKSTNEKTIIAGYPWFTDWGRDTMIALPGLTLTTKRYDIAQAILKTFALYEKDGLLPNVFPDRGETPAYNTVDAPLWFFEAVNKYAECTKNYSFVRENLYEALENIIRGYIKGTHNSIYMDKDGLINGGTGETQLTWMDAKVGDWVVTPRHGKAVEINALWYNALVIAANISKKLGMDGSKYKELSEKVKASFDSMFWNDEKSCLYDVAGSGYNDGSIRPNQIFAVSLSYPVIDGIKAVKVVQKVMEKLFTGYGLRSLSPDDKDYRPAYMGDQWSRDGAYHQGTVWAWLIGYFIDAYLIVNNYDEKSFENARRMMDNFKDHLDDGAIGYISEIFDGRSPHYPKGCFAQAWSVAEVLRAYVKVKGRGLGKFI